MWMFERCSDYRELMDELERFTGFWVGARLNRYPSNQSFLDLPYGLNRLLKLDCEYQNKLFHHHHILLSKENIVEEEGRLYFLDLDQAGLLTYIEIDDDDDSDPLVCCVDQNGVGGPVDRLARFLVSYSLHELMTWAALQENDMGECWDIDFPAVCIETGLPHQVLWARKPYFWPENLITVHLCNNEMISVEQEGAETRFLSSSPSLSAEFEACIKRVYPNW